MFWVDGGGEGEAFSEFRPLFSFGPSYDDLSRQYRLCLWQLLLREWPTIQDLPAFLRRLKRSLRRHPSPAAPTRRCGMDNWFYRVFMLFYDAQRKGGRFFSIFMVDSSMESGVFVYIIFCFLKILHRIAVKIVET